MQKDMRTFEFAQYVVALSFIATHFVWQHKAVEKFLYLFNDSIKLRLRSDVPIGVLLSGGLDSTSVLSVSNNI